eukprot:COSAG03_NODE_2447_length_2754_cov_1.782674_3_plen_61_part_00
MLDYMEKQDDMEFVGTLFMTSKEIVTSRYTSGVARVRVTACARQLCHRMAVLAPREPVAQ